MRVVVEVLYTGLHKTRLVGSMAGLFFYALLLYIELANYGFAYYADVIQLVAAVGLYGVLGIGWEELEDAGGLVVLDAL